MTEQPDEKRIEGHGGELAVAAAQAYGVDTMFTLSGAHVFPLYDGAVRAEPPLRLIDVRHEQSAVFAAEATAKLTRTPGLAVVTAGPGVTNSVSAMASARANGSPLVLVGGRAPAFRWGSGALQEFDHPPLMAPVSKRASTVGQADLVGERVSEAFALAEAAHRGPVFVDVPMDQLYSRADVAAPARVAQPRREPDPDDLTEVSELLGQAAHPVLVIGSDVWADGAEEAARRLAETLGLPVIANGMGRGVVPAGHPLLVTRARSRAFGSADLVLVAGAPLDFRLGYGIFGGTDASPQAKVVHLTDSPEQLAEHTTLAATATGDLALVLDGIVEAWGHLVRRPSYQPWVSELRAAADAAQARDEPDLTSAADPIHPARIYGELVPRLAEDAVVIGDGGDFVSFAGRYVEPRRPGCWLDPGPFGCLGTGMGYALAARLARPSAQVVVLLGDGAAGFSLLDVDSLVRHHLPVVMVVGNNGIWGLEKHPMQFLYGYDVVAELSPQTRYDEVVKALGGDGETVTDPDQVGAALDRAFACGLPYLVNVVTDPAIAYPRTTTGV